MLFIVATYFGCTSVTLDDQAESSASAHCTGMQQCDPEDYQARWADNDECLETEEFIYSALTSCLQNECTFVSAGASTCMQNIADHACDPIDLEIYLDWCGGMWDCPDDIVEMCRAD